MKQEYKLKHCILAPFIVPPQYADEQIPENIRARIMEERLLNKDKEEGTDTEVMYYISKASLMAPLSHIWYNIYMKLFYNFAESMKIDVSNITDKNVVLGINENEELTKIKKWIYQSQKKHLKRKLRRKK